MNMDFTQEIERLAAEKSFAELTPEERIRVLAEIPEDEYGRLHTLLGALPRLDAAAAPPPAMRGALLRRMKERPTPSGNWKVAMAMGGLFALGLLGGWLLHGNATVTTPALPEKKAAQFWVHDTIYVEKAIKKVRWRTRVLVRTETAMPTAPPMATAPEFRQMPSENNAPSWMDAPPAQGAPLSATPELLEFFTQADQK